MPRVVFFESRFLSVLIFVIGSVFLSINTAHENTEHEESVADFENKLSKWTDETNQYYYEKQQKATEFVQELEKDFANFQNKTNQKSSKRILQKWRSHVDNLHENIVGNPPKNPFKDGLFGSELEESFKNDASLRDRYLSFYTEYLATVKEIDDKQESLSKSYVEALELLSKYRATVLGVVPYVQYGNFLSMSLFFQDIKREIFIIPKIYLVSFKNKLTELQNSLQMGGIRGYYTVFVEFVIWFIFIVLFIVSVRKFDVFERKLENIFDLLIEKLSDSNKLLSIPLYLLEVFSRSVAWILVLASSMLAIFLLKNSLFLQMELPLNGLEIYCWYKITFFAIWYATIRLKASGVLECSYAKQLKFIKDISKFLKGAFFTFFMLSTINLVSSQSLLFHVFLWVGGALLFAYGVFLLNQWKVNIYGSIVYKSARVALPMMKWALRNSFLSIFAAPFLLIFLGITIVGSYFYYELQKYNWVKRLSSRIFILKFKTRSTDSEKKSDQSLPEHYCNQLLGIEGAAQDVFLEREEYHKIGSFIDDWIYERKKNVGRLLAIEGELGSGKTVLMQRVSKYYSKYIDTVLIDLEAVFLESTSDEVINQIFQNVVKDQKCLILIDNFHRCFLPSPQRRDLLKKVLSSFSVLEDNIFICVTAQRTSWNHVCNTLCLEDYFFDVISIPSFSYDELEILIDNRHKLTSYIISFEEIALKDEKISSFNDHAEKGFEKILKLIWHQSNGNPYIALKLWCLSLRVDKNYLVARYPSSMFGKSYKNIDTDSIFILSAILRYHSMNLDELRFALGGDYSEEVISLKINSHKLRDIIDRSSDNKTAIRWEHYCSILKHLETNGYVT